MGEHPCVDSVNPIFWGLFYEVFFFFFFNGYQPCLSSECADHHLLDGICDWYCVIQNPK